MGVPRHCIVFRQRFHYLDLGVRSSVFVSSLNKCSIPVYFGELLGIDEKKLSLISRHCNHYSLTIIPQQALTWAAVCICLSVMLQQETHHRDELANVNFLRRPRILTTKYKKRRKLS